MAVVVVVVLVADNGKMTGDGIRKFENSMRFKKPPKNKSGNGWALREQYKG